MNLCEIYVENIVSDVVNGNGWHTLVCDTNSWGHREYGVELHLSPREYEDVMNKGYYMG